MNEENVLVQLLDNGILWTVLLSWFAAQLLKVILTLLLDKKLDMSRMLGLGGMPSSHSAVVVSLAISVGGRCGFDSVLFAMACILAVITMTDAAGVRRAAGKQAAMINKIVQDIIQNGGDLPNETLKELLGHTPFQVMMGALLGGIVALICM